MVVVVVVVSGFLVVEVVVEDVLVVVVVVVVGTVLVIASYNGTRTAIILSNPQSQEKSFPFDMKRFSVNNILVSNIQHKVLFALGILNHYSRGSFHFLLSLNVLKHENEISVVKFVLTIHKRHLHTFSYGFYLCFMSIIIFCYFQM